MRRNDSTWYLLLYLALPTYGNRNDEDKHIRTIGRELKNKRATIRHVAMSHPSASQATGRYLFRFARYKPSDAQAIRLGEGVLYGMSLIHGPMLEGQDNSYVIRVPDRLIRDADRLDVDALVELEQSRPLEDRWPAFPRTTLSKQGSTTSNLHEAAWTIAGLALEDDSLFNAIRYLKRSHDNFYVYPGQIGRVASDRVATPIIPSHQTKSEEALHNAFKAIESVIGDPPRDDRKFFAKLRGIGIDPAEQVGWGRKVAISELLRKMNAARDKCSAHGSTPRRLIPTAELLDFQTCASEVVLAAIETARGAEVL